MDSMTNIERGNYVARRAVIEGVQNETGQITRDYTDGFYDVLITARNEELVRVPRVASSLVLKDKDDVVVYYINGNKNMPQIVSLSNWTLSPEKEKGYGGGIPFGINMFVTYMAGTEPE